MNADPFRPVPTREQYADDMAFLRGIREAEEHMEPKRLPQGSLVAFVVFARAAVTIVGLALVLSAWVF